MSSTIDTTNAAAETSLGLRGELRIRIGETVAEMRDRFDAFTQQNPDLTIEQDPSGEIVIMAPAGAEGSSRNSEIAFQLAAWARENGGRTFDSSAMFILANGAKRSPDAAWLTSERWDELPPVERKSFPAIAPDFVIELRSETDRVSTLKKKMQEYIDNGVRLGWMIDPQLKQVHVFQIGEQPVLLNEPATVSGGEVLRGFVLETARIFAA